MKNLKFVLAALGLALLLAALIYVACVSERAKPRKAIEKEYTAPVPDTTGA